MTDEIASLLRTMPRFASLAPEDAADVAMLARAFLVEDLPDGHVFTTEGKVGDAAYVIMTGQVVVVHETDAGEIELNRLGPGEMFGLLSLVDDRRRSATCRAEGPVRAASLPQTAFPLLLHSGGPAAHALQRTIGDQLARDFRHLEDELRSELGRH